MPWESLVSTERSACGVWCGVVVVSGLWLWLGLSGGGLPGGI